MFTRPMKPYRPSKDFFSLFFDGYKPIQKPQHFLGHQVGPQEELKQRRRYDEYIADVDSQFGRLLDVLKQSGFLENSVIIVTADHGQMFERGEQGHLPPCSTILYFVFHYLSPHPVNMTETISISQPTAWMFYRPSFIYPMSQFQIGAKGPCYPA